jgi:hypothetical protein
MCGAEKLVWRIFFLHFILRIRALLLLAYKKQTLPLVGQTNISASIIVIF